MRRTATAVLTLALGLAPWLALGACSSAPEPGAASASPGPALVVERFLQAANINDLETMMQLFGTAEQTIDELDGRAAAERRMYVLATLLRHQDYSIVGQSVVPGRLREATQLDIQLRKTDRTVDVPFVVVRKKSGGWIIEQIAVEPLTQRG